MQNSLETESLFKLKCKIEDIIMKSTPTSEPILGPNPAQKIDER